MSEIDNEILKEFVDESKGLIEKSLELLESIEGDPLKVQDLADYANEVDRIMGGAKNLALLASADHPLHMISDYSALCKAVGYKASQIMNNDEFFNICVALLLDATETLDALIDNIDKPLSELKKQFNVNFLERLRWVSNQFGAEFSATVKTKSSTAMGQNEIDDLMKKLGI